MFIEFETIIYEEINDIATIWINMQPANKMIPKFFEEIIYVINEFALKSKIYGIVISGKGRHFSSGADIKQLLELIKDNTIVKNGEIISYPTWYLNCKKAFNELYMLNKPVISAVSGFCVGSGLELALSAHIVICEKNARIGLPEATFGLLPGVNGTLRMSEKIGMKKAFELIIKGELLTGQEAYDIGLVDCVVGKKESYDYVLRLLNYLKENKVKFESSKKLSYLDEFMKYYKDGFEKN